MEVQQGLQVHSNGSMIQWAEDLGAQSVGFLARLYREIQSVLEVYMESRSSLMNGPIFVRGLNAAELMQQFETDPQKKEIVTFCRQVDLLLGGGLPLGELTEIAGPPGIGKTQWAMQLAVNVQTPTSFGGVAGSAIYIDTEGSLTPERCHDMAKHLVNHVTRKQYGNMVPGWFTVEGLLEGIQVLRVYDVATLDATISTLEKLCQNTLRPVKMIVVDSLAFPVRAESTTDFIGRTQQLTQWAMKLSQLAQSYPRKAVVVLNQMTTTNANTSNANTTNKENSFIVGSSLTPALGEAWAHAVTNRIILAEGIGGTRICRLVKSPRLPAGQAEYAVVEGGIRDPHVARSSKRPGDFS
eukprot:scaffold34646_cov173-Amphora_coffeaeformis.AAC.6